MGFNLGWVELLCAGVAIVLGIYYYLTSTYSFWKKKGVPGPEPDLFFGNFKDIMLWRSSFGTALQDMVNQFPDEPMVGIYARRTPLLLLRDPELLKDLLIKDFSTFSERGTPINEDLEPLGAHLFNLETKRWRPLRSKLSPTFTSGKIKHMFNLIVECAEYFEKYLEDHVNLDEPVDCREITAKFTTDVIGSCAFGIHMNALANEDSEFRKMGRMVFEPNLKTQILSVIRTAAPKLYQLLGIPAMPRQIMSFFMESMRHTMDYRKKNNVRRNDLVDILLEIKESPEKMDFELTDSLITAQAFVFFLAGFETSSSTMSHALYELAQQQDIQDRLRTEMIDTLRENEGKLSYECVKEMKYLHMVFQETLRLRPPVVFHMRKATSDYTFRGTNVTIPEGLRVWIPVLQIHHDPKNYPNPEHFDPERFTDEMCAARHPMTYQPFGHGPRNCIGERFAIHQTKVGLIKVLTSFKVDVCEKTAIPYKPSPRGILLVPEGGIHLKFTKIQNA